MKKSSSVIIIITFILVIVLGYFVIYPKSKSLVSDFAKRNELQTKIDSMNNEQAELKKLISQKGNIEGELNKALKYLPANADVPSFLVQVEAAAISSGNRLIEINFPETASSASSTQAPSGTGTGSSGGTSKNSPQVRTLIPRAKAQTTASSGLGKMDFEIKIEGSYFSLLSYLKNLENLLRYNVVTSISVQKKEGGDVLDTSIKGTVYYRK